MTDPKTFLRELRAEIEAHSAVHHPVLSFLANDADRDDFRRFGLQHYPLVGHFTRYMELLLLAAPKPSDKLWIAKVLVDEYGEGSDGVDHPALYLSFLRYLGVEQGMETSIPLHDGVTTFITEHLRVCSEGAFEFGLGIIGPAHEWAIPVMFPSLVKGLTRLNVDMEVCSYFPLHLDQDVEHGHWLETALEQCATTEAAQGRVRAGAMFSLELRSLFWDAVLAKIEGPVIMPHARSTEVDLDELRERVLASC